MLEVSPFGGGRMNKTLIAAGFIILFAGGLLYTLLPYTSFPCAWWSESPIGTAVMFAGFILMVVGLFYKPEAEKMKQETPSPN